MGILGSLEQPRVCLRQFFSGLPHVLEGILAIETENGREAARDFLLYIYQLRDELLGQIWSD